MRAASVLLVALCGLAAAQKYFNNIDYLGSGYNALMGNPWTDKKDPGFRLHIVDFSYNQDNPKITSDKRYYVPDQANVDPSLSCTYASQAFETHSAKEYSETLTQEAKIEGEFFAKFSVSTTFKYTVETIEKKDRKVVTTSAKCVVYTGQLLPFTALRVTKDFLSGLQKLPLDPAGDYTPYFKLFDFYGTHIAWTVEMGAKFLITTEFDQASYSKMTSTDLKVSAQASFKGFTGESMTEDERKRKDEFNSLRTYETQSFVGAQPARNGDWEAWGRDAGEDPFPMKYTLRPLSAIVNSELMPYLENADVVGKNIQTALNMYCGSTPGCDEKPNPIARFTLPVSSLPASKGAVQGILEVPSPYKVISGGARLDLVDCPVNRAFLAESYPLDVQRWTATSVGAEFPKFLCREQCAARPVIEATAIFDPQDDFEVTMVSNTCVMPDDNSVKCTATLPDGFYLTCGGMRAGAFSGSYPTANGWVIEAVSRSHRVSHKPYTSTVYAVGIRARNDKNVIDNSITMGTSNTMTKPSMTVLVQPGYGLIGGGGRNSNGPTNTVLSATYHYSPLAWGVETNSFICDNDMGPSTTTAYAVGLKINNKAA